MGWPRVPHGWHSDSRVRRDPSTLGATPRSNTAAWCANVVTAVPRLSHLLGLLTCVALLSSRAPDGASMRPTGSRRGCPWESFSHCSRVVTNGDRAVLLAVLCRVVQDFTAPRASPVPPVDAAVSSLLARSGSSCSHTTREYSHELCCGRVLDQAPLSCGRRSAAVMVALVSPSSCAPVRRARRPVPRNGTGARGAEPRRTLTPTSRAPCERRALDGDAARSDVGVGGRTWFRGPRSAGTGLNWPGVFSKEQPRRGRALSTGAAGRLTFTLTSDVANQARREARVHSQTSHSRPARKALRHALAKSKGRSSRSNRAPPASSA